MIAELDVNGEIQKIEYEQKYQLGGTTSYMIQPKITEEEKKAILANVEFVHSRYLMKEFGVSCTITHNKQPLKQTI